MKNRTIFTGDCLDIMRGMKDESVDLIYLDPPFNSNHNYAAPIGSEAAGAEFRDTWGLDNIDLAWWGEIEETYPALYKLLGAVKEVHGNSMMSYLIYMAARVMEMKRILKKTGTICLHCDHTAGHYLKLMLDSVFGKNMFRNEIVWHYGKMANSPRNFPQNHDTIYRYTKTDKWTFNPIKGGESEYKARFEKFLTGNKIYYGSVKHKKDKLIDGRVKKVEKELGRKITDSDILYDFDTEYKDQSDVIYVPKLKGNAKENQGYPTQKPSELLRKIILSSSNKGDIILDPFCGCASACVAAEQTGRDWIGIDISPLAYTLVEKRLKEEIKVGNKDEPTLFFNVFHREDIPQDRDGKPSKEIKHTLYGKQEGRCAGCRTWFEFRNMTKDHIVPISKGGADTDANLQLLCSACNSKKGTRTMEELIARLIKEGFRRQ